MQEQPKDRLAPGISRRTFTKVLVVGTGINLVVGGTLDGYLTGGGRHQRLLLAALRRRVSGLGFSEADFHRFAGDRGRQHRMDTQEHRFSFAWPVYAWTDLLQRRPDFASKIENWEEKLITQFFLSTDYFDAQRRGAPRYVAYYAPGRHPCKNPFAQLRNPDEARS